MEPQNVLDILLQQERRPLERAWVKMRKLSEYYGTDICFQIRALSFNQVADIRKAEENHGELAFAVAVVLAGVTEPNLKEEALLEKFHAVTPAELVQHMLTPGELEDLAREIEMLSGYRQNTVELVQEIKKNRLRPRHLFDVSRLAGYASAAECVCGFTGGRADSIRSVLPQKI